MSVVRHVAMCAELAVEVEAAKRVGPHNFSAPHNSVVMHVIMRAQLVAEIEAAEMAKQVGSSQLVRP